MTSAPNPSSTDLAALRRHPEAILSSLMLAVSDHPGSAAGVKVELRKRFKQLLEEAGCFSVAQAETKPTWVNRPACSFPEMAPAQPTQGGDKGANTYPWTVDGYWEYVGGLAGEFEADQMRDMLAQKGLRIVGVSDPAYTAWQPMETVPRDGRPVMLTGVTAGGSRWFMDGEVYAKGWIGGSAVNRAPNYWQPIPVTFAMTSTQQNSAED